MSKPDFVYVTYIATTPEKLWQALTDPELTRSFWFNPASDAPAYVQTSDWQPGSSWERHSDDAARTPDMAGKVVEANPPKHLVLSWARPAEVDDPAKHSSVSFDIDQPRQGLVRLTVTHTDLDDRMLAGISGGWPMVLSSLKTLLETGSSLRQAARAT